MGGLSLTQMYPPPPTFTEKQVPDLHGKVYLITGATSGIGEALAGILYSRNATVFLAARSPSKADATIASLRAAHPTSAGALAPVACDLADLASVRAAAAAFLSHPANPGGALHALFHNAGLLVPPRGSATAQGLEVQMGVHCVGPQLLTRLLEGALRGTAKREGEEGWTGGVRVVWVSSLGSTLAPPEGGVDVDNLDYHRDESQLAKYNISKAGEVFLAGVWAERLKDDGIVSVVLDPGNLKTNLQSNFGNEVSRIGSKILNLFLHPPIKGAYTILFAGLSPEVTVEKACDHSLWVYPWGRLYKYPRKDIVAGFKPESEGGTGKAMKFWDWCEKQIQEYL
ncbi:short-chain dehydrogenase protein [Pleurostoma richardsiae]|uniref:Short-chain dehydrogenase protein n=1 Tax=Pleurostoma richardsiae TaxID=41990 RepID=A0AA38VP39_9PEZI|nr:short-chain dehydrogenase protein [Pleurostoma richardsiae]